MFLNQGALSLTSLSCSLFRIIFFSCIFYLLCLVEALESVINAVVKVTDLEITLMWSDARLLLSSRRARLSEGHRFDPTYSCCARPLPRWHSGMSQKPDLFRFTVIQLKAVRAAVPGTIQKVCCCPSQTRGSSCCPNTQHKAGCNSVQVQDVTVGTWRSTWWPLVEISDNTQKSTLPMSVKAAFT